MNKLPFISVLVPCYNEEGGIPLLARRLEGALTGINYELILIDDGSSDGTAEIIQTITREDQRIKYLRFSRNFGHQAALKAGIDHARGDVIVTMDADLQHPPEKIPEMLALWNQGYEIITAIRDQAIKRGFMKRTTAKIYCRLLTSLTEERIPEGAADFRFFDKKVANVIKALPERDLYLRGLFAWVGFRQTTITYQEEERKHGKTKYGYLRMIRLAGSGITSFSTRPLRISLKIGLFFAVLAFSYGIYAVAMLLTGHTVTGWTSVIASILFLAGIQLIVLGIMGEYIGKLFMENKRRPVYIISKTNLETYKTIETT